MRRFGSTISTCLRPEVPDKPLTRASIADIGADTARWEEQKGRKYPYAPFQGDLEIGGSTLDCYVLEDDRRLIHKRGMARALSMKSGGGNVFIRAMTRKGLGSKLGPKLVNKLENPIVFKRKGGDLAHGYEADTLIQICDAIMDADEDGLLTVTQNLLSNLCRRLGMDSMQFGVPSDGTILPE